MIKNFYNEKTGLYYKSLKAAKLSSKNPYVYRTWQDHDGRLIGKEGIYAYGTSICTIYMADQKISERLKNKSHDTRRP